MQLHASVQLMLGQSLAHYDRASLTGLVSSSSAQCCGCAEDVWRVIAICFAWTQMLAQAGLESGLCCLQESCKLLGVVVP